ncbi:MAG TPA: prepilin-type N-terminal cleavage/methylation domain-containing protein [Acidobacteriota bacterium]|nr:prepilin-type N-terminal cleavage/methylation domain-containing protein [Acidobacteriota bacterium]
MPRCTRREIASFPAQSTAGYTLTETLITLAVLTIISAPMVALFYQAQAGFRAQSEQAELLGQMRIAMDQITRVVRQAGNEPIVALGVPPVQLLGDGGIRVHSDITGSVPSTSGNPAEATGDPDGRLDSIYEVVTFRHDPSSRLVYADIGYGEEVLARGIRELQFTFLDLQGNITSDPNEIARVVIEMTGQTEGTDLQMKRPYTLRLRSEVFIRSRTPQVIP